MGRRHPNNSTSGCNRHLCLRQRTRKLEFNPYARKSPFPFRNFPESAFVSAVMSYLPWLLPLAAALFYVAAALTLKRAAELGVGLWRSAFVSNLLAAIAFQGLIVLGGEWPPIAFWWQPFVTAVLFLAGQILTLFSLQRGDVSVATPVLGVKIVLVAAFSTWLGAQKLSWQLWLAAVLSTCGIACLSHSGAHKPGARIGPTLISAGLAASSFALFDVLVQKWSPAWGTGRFVPLTSAFVGLLSFTMIPLFSAPLRTVSRLAWPWLAGGGCLLALQSLLFVSAVAQFGQATAFNVVYGSRGVWSIVAVALLGHWFRSSEQHLDRSVFGWRWLGAALMFTAILLVLVSS
jgi:drug/metabolite transporter (DMT)-like permease